MEHYTVEGSSALSRPSLLHMPPLGLGYGNSGGVGLLSRINRKNIQFCCKIKKSVLILAVKCVLIEDYIAYSKEMMQKIVFSGL